MVATNLLNSIAKRSYNFAMTKPGTAAIIGGAALAGFAGKTLPAARDAALDVAFDDPNADETFLGRKLTPGAIMDANFNTGPGIATTMGVGAGLGALVGSSMSKNRFRGGSIGALAGAAVGAGIFTVGAGAYINRNERFFRESPYVANRKLNRDMSLPTPYNRRTSMQTSEELNASGNIVLGMHNLRRGG